jgi:hypothetical protein
VNLGKALGGFSMNYASFEVEKALSQAYETELELYGRALSLAEQLEQGLPAGRIQDSYWQQLADVIGEVAHVEAGISDAKAAWRVAGGEPGPQLRATLTLITRQIERLSSLIGRAERHHGARNFALQTILTSLLERQPAVPVHCHR